jgi:hypothetical protein
MTPSGTLRLNLQRFHARESTPARVPPANSFLTKNSQNNVLLPAPAFTHDPINVVLNHADFLTSQNNVVPTYANIRTA